MELLFEAERQQTPNKFGNLNGRIKIGFQSPPPFLFCFKVADMLTHTDIVRFQVIGRHWIMAYNIFCAETRPRTGNGSRKHLPGGSLSFWAIQKSWSFTILWRAKQPQTISNQVWGSCLFLPTQEQHLSPSNSSLHDSSWYRNYSTWPGKPLR